MSACFAEFYEELARIKQAIANGCLAAYLGGMSTGPELAAGTSARLLALLAAQAQRIDAEANDMERRSYGLARYFMAALADEVLGLNLAWEGREYWHEHLIERRLFGRSVAGRDFYVLADRILHSRGHNPIMEDLASVALIAMQLGFQGQYRDQSQTEKGDRYRQRLLHFVGAGSATTKPIFATAYQGLITQPAEHRLAPLSRWNRIGAWLFGLYLIASTLVWMVYIGKLTPVLPHQSTFHAFTPSGRD
jgi:type VI secretion system protein ImpK